MINFEGGAIAEEYQVEYVIDRVETTATAFMGLTMGCARCHAQVRSDHAEGVLPVLRVLQQRARGGARRPDGQRRAGAAAAVRRAAGAARRAEAAITSQESRARRRHRRAAAARVGSRRSRTSRPTIDTTGLVAHYELDGSFSDISGRYQHGRTVVGDPTFDAARSARRCRSTATPRSASATSPRSIAATPFSVAVWLKGRGNLPMSVFQKLDDRSIAAATSGGSTNHARRHPEVGGATDDHASRPTPGSAIRFARASGCRLGDWYHVALTYDGSGKAAGLRLYVDGKRSTSRFAGHSDRIVCDRRAAAPRQQGARQAVLRGDRRSAPLQPGADARADRGARDPLPAARHRLRRDRQAVEGRGRQTSASTSSPTPRPSRCERCTAS